MTQNNDDLIGWAKSYPFGHPRESYLFLNGQAQPLPAGGDILAGRKPVIASGSNAAPLQLARKYRAFEGEAMIPVTHVQIRDFDSVYNAHITSYGSVPATLFPSPGTVLETFITWLNDVELDVMHRTEQPGINYHFTELRGMAIEVDGLGPLDTAFAYISVVGCLSHEGAPASLAEIPARNRRFPAYGQAEMLAHLRDRIAPDAGLDPFILENIEDHDLREARSRELARSAQPFHHAEMDVVPVPRTGQPPTRR